MDRLPPSILHTGASGSSKQSDLRKQALGASSLAKGPLGAVDEDSTAISAASRQLHVHAHSSMPPPPGRSLPQPVAWDRYWDQKLELDIPSRGGKFTVYTAGSAGPVVMCLHGGGYTGLTWSLVASKMKDKYRVVAPDLRGHGLTRTDNDLDFSRETMSADIIAIWQHLFGEAAGGAEAGKKVPTLLVGHSMSGGLAVWAAASKQIPGLDGVVVIDVVEGTAIAALPHMAGVLAARPNIFPGVPEAIAWALKTGMSKNKEAAVVSIPSQLVPLQSAPDAAPGTPEASGATDPGAHPQGSGEPGPCTWRTPLEESRPYWEGWYTGLSEEFLKLTVPKMLLLAGTDRLDKPLIIGQMQGKFQLVLMPTAGHAIHEDEPDKTSEHLLQFLKRFRIGEPPMQFPRAPPGTKPVLPVVAGPIP